MGKQLGNANMQVLYGNYSDEMNRRMQAAQQAEQALAQSQQAQNSNFTQQLAGQQLASQVPYTGINAMGNSLGALFNGGTSDGSEAGADRLILCRRRATRRRGCGQHPLSRSHGR
jgi:hypothetical protein